MNGARGHICDYCMHPAGSPIARLEPGNPVSPLVGVTHADCWKRFMDEAEALTEVSGGTASSTAPEQKPPVVPAGEKPWTYSL